MGSIPVIAGVDHSSIELSSVNPVPLCSKLLNYIIDSIGRNDKI
jgi:hypothetical protein